MSALLLSTRIVLGVIAAASLVGIVISAVRGELAISLSLVPVAGWLSVVAARPERLPFFTDDIGALTFYRFGFLILAVVFLGMTLWISWLQLPRVLAKRYDGIVVGLDTDHPNAIGYAYPIIRFTTEDGQVHQFSNFSPTGTPFKKTSRMAPIHVGDSIKVIKDRGRFVGLVRNEATVFWFVLGVPLVVFLICATVSTVASAKLLSLGRY